MGKYFIKTYGCQANKNESERFAAYFEQELCLEPALDWRDPTVAEIVINTCSVRKAADDRVYALLRTMGEHFLGVKSGKGLLHKKITKPAKPSPHLVLTGCMSRYDAAKLKTRYPIISEVWEPGKLGFIYQPQRQDKTQAFISISAGCNSFCSYCVVPLARGREISRPMDDILAEVEFAVKDGFREITLLGQNVNSYGLEKRNIAARKNDFRDRDNDFPANRDQYERPVGLPPFVQLLQKISQFPAVTKIRFLTSNPWDFYDELIAEIGANPKIDRFIHLPVQSGSNRILQKMNRGYTREDYLALVNKLYAADPAITIGTDIIVGFCSETDQDFEDTLALVKEARLVMGFVAIYSPRAATFAHRHFPDDVPYSVKKQRWEILDDLLNKKQLSHRPKIV
jgi:tRNA-2-methylthio-N6-dimethylallyladenosine synthase